MSGKTGQVNIQRNLFLEKEEVSAMQDFMIRNIPLFLFENSTQSYGIVENQAISGNDFLIEVGTNAGTIKCQYDSYAIDNDMFLMFLQQFDNFPIPAQDLYYWIRVSHEDYRAEPGEVSVTIDGQVTGVGTTFTELLRGQNAKAPTRIRFYKEDDEGNEISVSNQATYEVISINSDTSMIISGEFIPESGVKFVVVGAYTLGTILSSEQKEGLYKYDWCKVEAIQEVDLNTPPTDPGNGYVENKTFYIARVRWSSETGVTIKDKREDYWRLNFGEIIVDTKAERDASNLTNLNIYDWMNKLETYNMLNQALKLYEESDNSIISGCIENGGTISEGLVVLDGELLKVDSHTKSGTYFEKVTVSDLPRATVTAASGNLKFDDNSFKTGVRRVELTQVVRKGVFDVSSIITPPDEEWRRLCSFPEDYIGMFGLRFERLLPIIGTISTDVLITVQQISGSPSVVITATGLLGVGAFKVVQESGELHIELLFSFVESNSKLELYPIFSSINDITLYEGELPVGNQPGEIVIYISDNEDSFVHSGDISGRNINANLNVTGEKFVANDPEGVNWGDGYDLRQDLSGPWIDQPITLAGSDTGGTYLFDLSADSVNFHWKRVGGNMVFIQCKISNVEFPATPDAGGLKIKDLPFTAAFGCYGTFTHRCLNFDEHPIVPGRVRMEAGWDYIVLLKQALHSSNLSWNDGYRFDSLPSITVATHTNYPTRFDIQFGFFVAINS
jgi:hypothetical protein